MASNNVTEPTADTGVDAAMATLVLAFRATTPSSDHADSGAFRAWSNEYDEPASGQIAELGDDALGRFGRKFWRGKWVYEESIVAESLAQADDVLRGRIALAEAVDAERNSSLAPRFTVAQIVAACIAARGKREGAAARESARVKYNRQSGWLFVGAIVAAIAACSVLA